MPASKNNEQPQLLFVDGTFEELAKEMAEYLKAEEATQLLSKDKVSKEDVLAKLVAASAGLSTVPEKEYTAASNLMIHLVLQSADPKKYLQDSVRQPRQGPRQFVRPRPRPVPECPGDGFQPAPAGGRHPRPHLPRDCKVLEGTQHVRQHAVIPG
ncbi:hypothetical protein J3458_004629 [Metarhizium acridum]|uniref:uncharacterized protein n=1 Tax=Metarhizium acridum TaxID=92637 RepID=UPI001C6C6143|nr:hypothetical protein J3458_004629 [Metarhizium acridum]